MFRWTLAAGLVLAACGLAPAQYYVRPPTNPYFRPQLSPYFTYYYGPGGLPGAFVVPPNSALGGLRPTGPVGAPTLGGVGGMGVDDSLAGAGQGNDTGHPTRFMAYSQYFLNQGASTAGRGAAAGPPAQPTVSTFLGTGSLNRTAQPGVRPPRGRENIRPGGR